MPTLTDNSSSTHRVNTLAPTRDWSPKCIYPVVVAAPFPRDVAVNPDDAAITAAIIRMKSLRLKVIAEGVEDEAQMSFLRAHQCDEIQGYYFSKPLAVDMTELPKKMRAGPWLTKLDPEALRRGVQMSKISRGGNSHPVPNSGEGKQD